MPLPAEHAGNAFHGLATAAKLMLAAIGLALGVWGLLHAYLLCWALVGAVVTLGCALVVVVALVGSEAVDVWLH
jgi:hypothetical protein